MDLSETLLNDATQRIIERSRQRAIDLDLEMLANQQASWSGMKRKSDPDFTDDSTPEKPTTPSEPVSKKLSFSEQDMETVRKLDDECKENDQSLSLYPMAHLEELRKSTGKLPEMAKMETFGQICKEKMAELAAKTANFECEFSTKSATKEAFMRGHSPKQPRGERRPSILCCPSSKELAGMGINSSVKNMEQDESYVSPKKQQQQQQLRFSSPLASVYLDESSQYFDGSTSTTIINSTDLLDRSEPVQILAKERQCGIDAFIASSRESSEDDSSCEAILKPFHVDDHSNHDHSLDVVKVASKSAEITGRTRALASFFEQNSTKTTDLFEGRQRARKIWQEAISEAAKNMAHKTDKSISNIHARKSVEMKTASPKSGENVVETHEESRKTAIANLRNRWEVSSSTGARLHPKQKSEQLLDEASKMVKSVIQDRAYVQSRRSKSKSPQKPEMETLVDEEIEQDDNVDEGEQYRYQVEEMQEQKLTEDEEETPESTNADQLIDGLLQFTSASPSSETPQNEPPTLAYSVSFYRQMQRQQRLGSATKSVPIIDNREKSPIELKTNTVDKAKIQTKINMLNEMVAIQQEQIAQASRALAFCHSTQEFRGSREEVDAQRALLLATERRRVSIVELNKLSLLGGHSLHMTPQGPRGTLTISHIDVRLNRDFVNGHVNYSKDLLYYFIVLLKHDGTINSTSMVTSDEGLRSGSLQFPHYLKLANLSHDFQVLLEIYALRTRREMIPHEEKYRLSKGLTLKRSKQLISPGRLVSICGWHSLLNAGFSSPGGPSAVIDPSFQKVGYFSLNLHGVNRGKFLLQDVQYPIDGSMIVKLRCYPDSAGQSVYQEVTGLGSWTRFYCLLKQGAMRFWKYPDEQLIKEPELSVDLSLSTSKSAFLADRDDCSRPNTIFIDLMLVDNDGKRQQMRILMSADSKTDCQKWMNSINETLMNLHMWVPK